MMIVPLDKRAAARSELLAKEFRLEVSLGNKVGTSGEMLVWCPLTGNCTPVIVPTAARPKLFTTSGLEQGSGVPGTP